MPNRSSATRQCRQTAPRTSQSAMTTPELYQSGYQQALSDFAVAALLGYLETHSDAHFDAVTWHS